MFDPTKPPEPNDDCAFCEISRVHKPYDPLSPPSVVNSELTAPSSFIVLSTPTVIAFLDIMPLSRGHLLVCPRNHRPKLTDTSPEEAALLGAHVRVLSEAVSRATGVYDWNVVQNNGAAAAQVVPHVHYHLIPRPEIRASGKLRESFTMFGRGQREDLDEDEAEVLAKSIREKVAEVMKEDEEKRRGSSKLWNPKPKL